MLNIIQKHSPNFKSGRDCYKIMGITLHITSDSKRGNATNWLCDPKSGVSAHYVVEKNGDVFQLVGDADTSWAQGIIVNPPTAKIYKDMSSVNPNKYMLSIECVSAGEPLEAAQRASLIELINILCNKHSIPRTRYNIIGHYELSSAKPFDPIKSYSVDEIVEESVFQNNLDKLVAKGIINSKDYWKTNAIKGGNCKGDYVRALINNISKFL